MPASGSGPAETGPTLSFSREIFAALSPSPYLRAHLAPSKQSHPSIRPNGRTPTEFRPPVTNTSSLTHCAGSAVVRLGDTAAVCGIRAEILMARDVPDPPRRELRTKRKREGAMEVDGMDGGDEGDGSGEDAEADAAELEALGLLVPNVELSTGCSPAHLPGNPPGPLAQSLAHRILTLLHSSRLIRMADLRITRAAVPDSLDTDGDADDEDGDETQALEVVAYWTLYIDVLFISLDGAAFDAAWGSVITALRDVRLPRAAWNDDAETILCLDSVAESRRLRLGGLPVAASFVAFSPGKGSGITEGENKGNKSWVLADPDAFEEGICRESVTVVVICDGEKPRIQRIEKSGGAIIGREAMKDVVDMAERRWKQWHDVLTTGSN